MFVYLTNKDGLTRLINLSKIQRVYKDSVCFDTNFMTIDDQEAEQIENYLKALKLLYEPSKPMHPVGEPLREIVGGINEFIKTKGRTD